MTARMPLLLFGLDIAEARVRDDRSADRGRAPSRPRRVHPGLGDQPPGRADRDGRRSACSPPSGPRSTSCSAVRVATPPSATPRAVAGTGAKVVDTRKTTPGFRVLEKAAVLAGGAGNHAFDLGSGVLIKDNHIAACGGVRAAVVSAKAARRHRSDRGRGHHDSRSSRRRSTRAPDIVLPTTMTPAEVAVARARPRGQPARRGLRRINARDDRPTTPRRLRT